MATASSERGSDKLVEQLLGGKGAANEAAFAKALGVSAASFKLERIWWKGQPKPDIFWAKLRVQPEAVGDIAGRLLKVGMVLEGFPLGMPPVVDGVVLNVSNLPQQLR